MMKRNKLRSFAVILSVTLACLALGRCNYLVDGVRYLTQEDYTSGKEARYRIQTAALIGYGVRLAQGQATTDDALAPLLSAVATRVATDREYLETSVASCEEIMLAFNFATSDLTNHVLAGLACNLGPGKSPNEL